VAVVVWTESAVPQTPTQYPPNQYPQQYPPGQYPPGQYPPGQYPTPGPSIPIPPIRWPKKKPKDESGEESKKDKKGGTKESKAEPELKAFEGTLRSLGEKELLLETDEGKVLRFRLLAKTKFVDKAGEPMRDSLLKPGDRISVQVDPDDDETARRVVMREAGTTESRTEAAKPVEPAKASAPSKEDAAAAKRAEDPLIEAAREAAENFTKTLPDYVVEQVTTRQVSTNNTASWTTLDTVVAEVAVVKGKEEYRKITVNGKTVSKMPEETGAWTTGEFSTTLDDLFSDEAAARFVKQGEDAVGGRDAVLYDYSVEAAKSNWVLVSPAGQKHRSAHRGQIWIDLKSQRVLKIEQRAVGIPANFDHDTAESKVEYGWVTLEGGTFLLPVKGSAWSCERGANNCSRNEILFRNYRKFGSESKISF
jgi:hypothetical protein